MLAVLVPLVAIVLVLRSFDVAARFQLSWPLALHPDGTPDDAQLHLRPDTTPTASEVIPETPVSHAEAVKGQFTRRIVAVGDLHGDIGNALEVLQMAGVVDEDGKWSGGVDFFVQTGDIIDR